MTYIKKRSLSLIRVLSLILICLTLVTVVSPAMEVSAASATVHKKNAWYNAYYVNRHGAYCYNRYYYPGKSIYNALKNAKNKDRTLVAIEAAYKQPGTTYHDGGITGLSYSAGDGSVCYRPKIF